MPCRFVQRKPTLPLKIVESSRSEEAPTTSPRLLIARAALPAVEPRFPRSTGVPSASQRIACGPTASGGGLVLLHTPDTPTACPLSFIHRATLTVSFPRRGRGLTLRRSGPQMTAWYRSFWLGNFEVQDGSGTVVSATPAICPKLFTFPTVLLLPPSVGRLINRPPCQTAATHSRFRPVV